MGGEGGRRRARYSESGSEVSAWCATIHDEGGGDDEGTERTKGRKDERNEPNIKHDTAQQFINLEYVAGLTVGRGSSTAECASRWFEHVGGSSGSSRDTQLECSS